MKSQCRHLKMSSPKIILLISGKRKSGKDYISEEILEMLTKEKCEIVRISEPIKGSYATTHNLDLVQLMGDSAYKEKYRLDMITWSEAVRNKDYGYFCKAACENAAIKPVWIVSDIRRKTDLKWFNENYKDIIKTVRINADVTVREQRGLIFTKGVDDAASECNLDDVNIWDFIIDNNNTSQSLAAIEKLYNFILNTIC